MCRFSLLISLLLMTPVIESCSPGVNPMPCDAIDCRLITHYMLIERRKALSGDSLKTIFQAESSHFHKTGRADQLSVGSGSAEAFAVYLNNVQLDRIETRSASSTGEDSYNFQTDSTISDTLLAPPDEWNTWIVENQSRDSLLFRISTPRQRAEITTIPEVPNDTLTTDSDLQIVWPPTTSDMTQRSRVTLLGIGIEGENANIGYLINESFIESEFIYESGVTISRDSLESWKGRYKVIYATLQHYTIRDTALTETNWGRTVILERDFRTLFLPVD